jgi:hypothetical protein
MNQQITDNDKRVLIIRDKLIAITPDDGQQNASLSGKAIESAREAIVALQQFAVTARSLFRHANLLNLYLFKAQNDNGAKLVELPVPFDTFKKISDARDEQVQEYQKIRAFARDVLDCNLIFSGSLTLYFLPVLYAVLGALAYALRSISQRLSARTYTPSYADHARFPIAVAAGLVVGSFTDFTKEIPLSPIAVGFLVGYGVEVFFSFLDAVLETLKKART